MPKQIFQRPAPVRHDKIPNLKGNPFGQDGWSRKKGKKPAKGAKVAKLPPAGGK